MYRNLALATFLYLPQKVVVVPDSLFIVQQNGRDDHLELRRGLIPSLACFKSYVDKR